MPGLAFRNDGFTTYFSEPDMRRKTLEREYVDHISDLPATTVALARRGYTEPEIGAILGENWLRVFGIATSRSTRTGE